MALLIKQSVLNKIGVFREVMLPAKRVVCPACDGSGQTLRGGLRGAVLSDDCINDPDFMASYMGGSYDVTCGTCRGNNVILQLDYDALSPRMKECVDRYEDAEAAYAYEAAAERRAGC